MKRLYAIAAALLLAVSAAMAREGPLDGSYYQGYFDDETSANDWFFDRYGEPLSDWSDSGVWYYSRELFTGHYDDGVAGDDWFFDAYGEPAGRGLFGA